MRRILVALTALAFLASAPTATAAVEECVKPGALASIALSDPTTTTLRLSWGPAVGADRYHLSWFESGTDGRYWYSSPDEYRASGRVTLTNLRPGRTYSVSVTPVAECPSSYDRVGTTYSRSANTLDPEPPKPAPAPTVTILPPPPAPPAAPPATAPAPPSLGCDPSRTRVKARLHRDTMTTVEVTAWAEVDASGSWVRLDDPLKLVYWRAGAWRTWRSVDAGTSRVNSTGAVIGKCP